MSYLEHDLAESVVSENLTDSVIPEGFEMASQEEQPEIKVEIPCAPVSANLQIALKASLDNLDELKKEIQTKISEVWHRAKNIEEVMNKIAAVTDSAIDEKKKGALLESVAMYSALLNGILAEIDNELAEFLPYSTSGHPATIKVPETEVSNSSEKYLESSVKFLRSQAKSIRKYLMVSYSRYMYGFELQEKRLIVLAHRINQVAAAQQQQQKQSEVSAAQN